MTDTRFLSNNFVTCEANHVKFKTLLQDSYAQKVPNEFRNRSRGLGILPKSVNFQLLGAMYPLQCT